MTDSQDHCMLTSVMASINHVALLILVSTAAGYGNKPEVDWTYFSLVEEWPASVCIDFKQMGIGCKIPSTAQPWFIHGLWPENGSGDRPNNCNISTDFDVKYIKGVLADMQKYWPSLRADSRSEVFWKHEWDAHGRCASTDPVTGDEKKYFTKTLNLREKFNVYDMLSKAGIEPSTSKTYRVKDIATAIRKSFTKTPSIQCVQEKDVYYLMRVQLCLNKALEPMDCAAYRSSMRSKPSPTVECGKDVKYPKIKTELINSNNHFDIDFE